MKSPLAISYKDLIHYQIEQVERLRAAKINAIRTGQIHQNGLIHNLACAERILILLKKSNRDPQMDLFELNREQNRR